MKELGQPYKFVSRQIRGIQSVVSKLFIVVITASIASNTMFLANGITTLPANDSLFTYLQASTYNAPVIRFAPLFCGFIYLNAIPVKWVKWRTMERNSTIFILLCIGNIVNALLHDFAHFNIFLCG